jgi:hypothetical protein
VKESLAVPIEGRADPWNVGGVESKSEDVHGPASA